MHPDSAALTLTPSIFAGIGVLGVIGDLFESLVKRVGKCKDSGTYFTG